MTQLESARRGVLTAEMTAVAAREGVDPEQLMEGLAQGTIVLPANSLKEEIPAGGYRAGADDQGQRQHRDFPGSY